MKKLVVIVCFISMSDLFGQDLKLEISSAYGIDSVYLNNRRIDWQIESDLIGFCYFQTPQLFDGEVLSVYSKKRIYSVSLPENCTNLVDYRRNDLEINFEINQFVTGRLNGSSRISGMPLATYTLEGNFLIKESYGIVLILK